MPTEANGGHGGPTEANGTNGTRNINATGHTFLFVCVFLGGVGSGCIGFMTPSGAKCGMMDPGIITSKELVRPLCFDAAYPLVSLWSSSGHNCFYDLASCVVFISIGSEDVL